MMQRALELLRDPLALFLAVGAVLFFIAREEGDGISYDIDLGTADIKRLQDQWTMQMRRPPTQAELDGLIEQLVREEIYYREARRLNLDHNDTIVRRRMVQKLTFLTEDLATVTPASDETLEAFYARHPDKYRLAERYTFEHRYFSKDRRDDAQADARKALTDATVTGDPFMLQTTYASRSQREIRDQFGAGFAEALVALETSPEWQGPIESAYGWHLVRLTGSTPARLPPLEEIRDRVSADAKQARRAEANAAYYDNLKAQYTITLPTRPANPE